VSRFFPVLVLYFYHASIFAASDNAFAYRFSSFSYSEAVSIHDVLNQWGGNFYGGSKAYTYNLSSAELYHGNYRVSLIHRYDYEMAFSRDTAEFYYITDNHLGLQSGRTYQLNLKVKQHYSRGLQLNYLYQARHDLSLNFGLGYLQGMKLSDGQLSGYTRVLSNSDYDFQFDLAYYYSKDALLERRVEPPKGNGFASDIDLDWRPTPNWRVDASIKDLYSRIYWLKTPVTTGRASSDVKRYDENGYVIFEPALSGVESKKFFVQKLSTRYYLTTAYQLNNFQINGEVVIFPLQTIYTLGATFDGKGQWKYTAAYLAPVNAIRLGIAHRVFALFMTADHLPASESNTLALLLGLNGEF